MSYKLYDAEIEYLKTLGNADCYIDIPMVHNSFFKKEFEFKKEDNSARYDVVVDSSDVTSFRFWNERSNYIAYLSEKEFGLFVYGSEGKKIKVIVKQPKVSLIVDGRTTEQTFDIEQSKTSNIFRLFSSVNNRRGVISIYYCKVWDESDNLVLDLIPVRVGNVGYMFDKVSMKLFGNSGTGSFILGPDVAPGRYANEVAFLESTGSQYIDTGIVPTDNIKVALNANYTYTDVSYLLGCISTDYRTNCFAFSGNKDLSVPEYFRCFVSGNSMSVMTGNVMAKDTPELHSCVLDKNHLEIDGVEYPFTYAASLPLNISHSIYLYARNNIGTADYFTSMKVYGFKIWQNDTLVRDFIPVEYNNIGYLYDKVSGEFFANQGTGKFVLGHRAPRFDGKACARSYTRRQLLIEASRITPMNYIQDGLISLYDGEWNAGVNIHSSNPTVWKDLKGSWGDLSIQGTVITGSNCFTTEVARTKATGGYFLCGNTFILPSDCTMTAVVKIVGEMYNDTEGTNGRWYGRYPFNRNFEAWAAIDRKYPMMYARINSSRLGFNFPLSYPSNSSYCSNMGWSDTTNQTYTVFTNGTTYNSSASSSTAISVRPCFWYGVGNIYSIRIYNRKLSMEELRFNMEIDKKRFGLTF